MKKETSILDLIDKYIYQSIFQFTSITKGAELTSNRLAEMIIVDGMTFQENELLTEILYNREAVLAGDFTEMGKIKKKMAPVQEIQTIEYKAQQVPNYQITKALSSTIIDMLQRDLR